MRINNEWISHWKSSLFNIFLILIVYVLVSGCGPLPEIKTSLVTSASPSSGQAPLTVTFGCAISSTSDSAVVSNLACASSDTISWNFGDGTTGTGGNPTHTYAAAGTYTVTATIAALSHSTTVTVTDPPLPVKSPSGSVQGLTAVSKGDKVVYSLSGIAGSGALSKMTAYRSLKSKPNEWVELGSVTCNAATCSGTVTWDTSNEEIGEYYVVVNSYQSDGGQCSGNAIGGSKDLWTNALSGWTDCGSLSRLTSTVSASPLSNLNTGASPASGYAPLTVDFRCSLYTRTKYSAIVAPCSSSDSVNWNFGDGTTGTGAASTHTYAVAGTYTATLTVTDSAGNSRSTSDVITVNDPIVIDAKSSPDNPLAVQLTASGSSEPPDYDIGYNWNFGDGTTGSGVSVSHKYAAAGTYAVTVRLTHTAGSSQTGAVRLITSATKTIIVPIVNPDTPDLCQQKVKSSGVCDAIHVGYEFDSSAGQCVKEEMSGCSLEAPFKTLKECQKSCILDRRVFCTEDERNAACTKESAPVCGVDLNVRCVTTPCGTQTYSNKCIACSDKNVEYWTQGTCPGSVGNTGSLTVKSFDSVGKVVIADVYVDDVLKGKTPLTLEGVASGTYAVQVKLFGYKYSEKKNIEVGITPVSQDFKLAKCSLITVAFFPTCPAGTIVTESLDETGCPSPPKCSPITTTSSTFFYQLQKVDLDKIRASNYDFVVIDYFKEGSSTDHFVIDRKKEEWGKTKVLSYLSIGEAESYRYYWQEKWDFDKDGKPDAGAPAWLDIENPDWKGNYKVQYWDPEWQAVIFGYLDQIIDAGFDGAYLDIIDGYEFYEAKGSTTAKQDMINFVININKYAKAKNPDFMIFPQNVPQLTQDSKYLNAIAGVGKESTWYNDNIKRPDVKVPDDDVAQINELADLDRVVSSGKVVLAIDYPTEQSKVDDFYKKARERKYIPLVSNRALDGNILLPSNPTNPPPDLNIITVDVPLKEGWNLISVPFKDKEFTVDDSNCEIDYSSGIHHYYFDAAKKDYVLITVDSLKKLSYGKGYWINSNNNCNLKFSGKEPVTFSNLGNNQDGTLFEGSNLIGAPAKNNLKVSDNLGSCVKEDLFIQTYNPDEIVLNPDGSFVKDLNGVVKKGAYITNPLDDSILIPGKAYWVKTLKQCKLEENLYSNQDFFSQIKNYETRADGAIRVTDCSKVKSCQNPVFSPEGKEIIFTRFMKGYNQGPSEIVRLNIETGREEVIVKTEGDNVNVPYGSWIGNKIIFSSDLEGIEEIYSANDKGGDVNRLTKHDESEGSYIEPVYNPVNTKLIVFEHARETGEHSLRLLDLSTGGGFSDLTNPLEYDDRLPSFSPDGKSVSWQRTKVGEDNWRIYAAELVLAPKSGLTNTRAISPGPDNTDNSWMWNGKYILSSTTGDGKVPNIFAFPVSPVNVDVQSVKIVEKAGSVRVSKSQEKEDGAPTNSPDGKLVAFESHILEDENSPSEIWVIRTPQVLLG